jgi:hypothetical protein
MSRFTDKIFSEAKGRVGRVVEAVKPHFTPFNLTIAAVVGVVTGGFVTLILLMLMVATNFNLLGAIE